MEVTRPYCNTGFRFVIINCINCNRFYHFVHFASRMDWYLSTGAFTYRHLLENFQYLIDIEHYYLLYTSPIILLISE